MEAVVVFVNEVANAGRAGWLTFFAGMCLAFA